MVVRPAAEGNRGRQGFHQTAVPGCALVIDFSCNRRSASSESWCGRMTRASLSHGRYRCNADDSASRASRASSSRRLMSSTKNKAGWRSRSCVRWPSDKTGPTRICHVPGIDQLGETHDPAEDFLDTLVLNDRIGKISPETASLPSKASQIGPRRHPSRSNPAPARAIGVGIEFAQVTQAGRRGFGSVAGLYSVACWPIYGVGRVPASLTMPGSSHIVARRRTSWTTTKYRTCRSVF